MTQITTDHRQSISLFYLIFSKREKFKYLNICTKYYYMLVEDYITEYITGLYY